MVVLFHFCVRAILSVKARNLYLFWTVSCLVSLLFLACSKDKVRPKGCHEDKDCGNPSAWHCETQTGACFCINNDACASSEFCNTVGFCQDRSGCEKNEDCLNPGLFCDTTTGTCLTKGR